MKKVLVGIAVVVLVVLSFIFNRYDLDISIYLTKFNNGFYEFLDKYGEFPIYIGPILFGGVYSVLSKKTLHKFISVSIAYIASLISSVKFITNNNVSLSLETISIALAGATLVTLLAIFGFSRVKEENLVKIKDLAFLGLLVSVISFCAVSLIKGFWGRVRFRDLSEGYSEFTNLFTINGFNGNHSFPSGHTNAGTSILLIALLVPRFSDKKWLKYLVSGLCFGYIALLGVSRIIVSAHYASDVLYGFLIGFTTFCITYSVLRRKGVINASSNKC